MVVLLAIVCSLHPMHVPDRKQHTECVLA